MFNLSLHSLPYSCVKLGLLVEQWPQVALPSISPGHPVSPLLSGSLSVRGWQCCLISFIFHIPRCYLIHFSLPEWVSPLLRQNHTPSHLLHFIAADTTNFNGPNSVLQKYTGVARKILVNMFLFSKNKNFIRLYNTLEPEIEQIATDPSVLWK